MVVRMPAWPPGPGYAARPVVVGVDGAPEAAVDFGAQEARLRGCELVLLHAIDEGSDVRHPVDPGSGVTVHRRYVEGPAWRALTDASLRAAAVVIGSRGHGGLQGLLLGSVGQRLIREAHYPVFIVR